MSSITSTNTIAGPWLILCEGKGDKRILEKLIALHSLGPDYHVQSADGKDNFPRMINGLQGSPDFRRNVKALTVIADNDEDPTGSFQAIVSAFTYAGLPAPASPELVANDRSQKKATAVYMLPSPGVDGALETLCVQAAYAQWNIRPALDAFVIGTDARNWNATKQAKMRMQSIIAATCQCNPDTTLANLFDKKEQYHLSVSHSCFDDLVAFLRKIPTAVQF